MDLFPVNYADNSLKIPAIASACAYSAASTVPLAIFSKTWRNISGGCAPEIAYLRSKMKHGTPWMPTWRAKSSSARTSATPSSGLEIVGDRVGFEPGLAGDGGEHRVVADVAAGGEVGAEQRLDDGVLALAHAGVADQAMGIERARRALDRVEVEGDAVLAAGIDDRVVPVAAALIAELGAQVVGAVHAFARHVGIELEGPPVDRTVPAGSSARARSKRRLPMKHHGQMASETMSTLMPRP